MWVCIDIKGETGAGSILENRIITGDVERFFGLGEDIHKRRQRHTQEQPKPGTYLCGAQKSILCAVGTFFVCGVVEKRDMLNIKFKESWNRGIVES